MCFLDQLQLRRLTRLGQLHLYFPGQPHEGVEWLPALELPLVIQVEIPHQPFQLGWDILRHPQVMNRRGV
jgi:hypothetical protein